MKGEGSDDVNHIMLEMKVFVNKSANYAKDSKLRTRNKVEARKRNEIQCRELFDGASYLEKI